jgi:transposase
MTGLLPLTVVVDQLTAQRDLLVGERDRLVGERERLLGERDQYRQLYLNLLEHCRKLELGLRGQKSERLSPDQTQLSLALLATLLGDCAANPDAANPTQDGSQPPAEQEPEQAPPKPKPKPKGRRPLPKDLPRIEVEILPPEVHKEGLDAFERIGCEVTETLERRRASWVVVRVIRPKFVRKDRERYSETKVLISEPPELPIERGLAGPALLAQTLVWRWQDHLPLHRIEQIFGREGMDLCRSTLCGWHLALGELVSPLIAAMWQDAKTAHHLCIDATGVLVQARQQCRSGHFFVVVAPEQHVLFSYSKTHDSAAVQAMLGDYVGYLVADAHSIYNALYATGRVLESGCWAHGRRYFFKALGSAPELAQKGLALIGKLFEIERSQQATGPPEQRHAVRQEKSRPLVDQFFAFCDAQVERVLDATPIARAIGYARNQREALKRFLDDGRLPMHNNISELMLRLEAVGRKNWLFLGSDQAGTVNANFMTLLASCRLHGIEPWSYLRDLLCLLPRWPVQRVIELCPLNWRKTLQEQETQLLLGSNVFRNASLSPLVSHPPQI